MGKVQKLPDNLANLIAAGEVVERPASVVKELVENCIDANATEIEIRLLESGIKEIKIIDNGDGMSRSDAILAVERHATSKISSVADLFNINTLGFRGEALPSIASVSNFLLKTYDGITGTQISIDFGKNKSVSSAPFRQGTEILIRELFVRTPARLKYLKSTYLELTYVIDYIRQIALSNPKMKISVFNDSKRVFYTSGSGEMKNTIFNIYGLEVVNNLLEVTFENSDYKITGYICKAEINKSNSKMINFSVNGRAITNYKLNRALINAYGSLLPSKRYPVAFLNIEVDNSLVDVNVHPSKLEVRFSKEQTITDLVYETVKDTLLKKQTVMRFSDFSKANDNKNTEPEKTLNEVGFNESLPLSESKTISKLLNEFQEVNNQEGDIVYDEELPNEDYLPPVGSLQTEILEEGKHNEFLGLRYIGQFHSTYILAENFESLFIVDQHAAAERINYEKILDSFSNDKVVLQELLVPITLEYTSSEALAIDEYMPALKIFGMSIDKFDDKTFVVRNIPVSLLDGKEKENIKILIDVILNNRGKSLEGLYEKMAANISCKASIKANKYIVESEVERLFADLSKCKQPYTCPHGRPTIIKYTSNDIERLFKRR